MNHSSQQGFGDGSVLPEDLDEYSELILDNMPCYASPLITTDVLPGEEREMAVDDDLEQQEDEEEVEQKEEEDERKLQSLERERERSLPYTRIESISREESPLSNPYQIFTQEVSLFVDQ